ncbi:Tat pathway signal sequence domain protein, partial [Corynebacterium accolens ATCC 49726]
MRSLQELFMSPSLSRRGLLKASALAVTAGAIGAATPSAAALGPVRGTIIDFSSGIPSPAAIKRAGHIGAIRYVSNKRPGAAWMTGKPVTLQEAAANAAAGLPTASVYQFGRAETADWKQGAAGAAIHAPQAISLHKAAGGPT